MTGCVRKRAREAESLRPGRRAAGRSARGRGPRVVGLAAVGACLAAGLGAATALALPRPIAAQAGADGDQATGRVTGQVHRTIRRGDRGHLPRPVHGVRLGTTTAGVAGSGFRTGSPAAPGPGAFGPPAAGRPGRSGGSGGILLGLPRHLVHGPLVSGGRVVRESPGFVRVELPDRTIVLAPFRAFEFDAAGNRRVFLLGPTLWPLGFLFFPWAASSGIVSFEAGYAGAAASAGGDRGEGAGARRARGAPYRPPLPDPGPPLPGAAERPRGVCAEAAVRMAAGAERELRIATGPLGANSLAQAEEILAARVRRGEPIVLRGWDESGLIAPGGLVRDVKLVPCAERAGSG